MKHRVLLPAVVILLTGAFPAGAGDRLSLRVSPSVAFAPANLVVRATVAANDTNRAIAVIAESPEFYRSSEIELDGQHAPRVSQFVFRSLPGGVYDVLAILKGPGGERLAQVRTTVNVIESGSSDIGP